jgi:hypothetical protein
VPLSPKLAIQTPDVWNKLVRLGACLCLGSFSFAAEDRGCFLVCVTGATTPSRLWHDMCDLERLIDPLREHRFGKASHLSVECELRTEPRLQLVSDMWVENLRRTVTTRAPILRTLQPFKLIGMNQERLMASSKSVSVDSTELRAAFEFASAGNQYDHSEDSITIHMTCRSCGSA